jgi:hypothetical protein
MAGVGTKCLLNAGIVSATKGWETERMSGPDGLQSTEVYWDNITSLGYL